MKCNCPHWGHYELCYVMVEKHQKEAIFKLLFLLVLVTIFLAVEIWIFYP